MLRYPKPTDLSHLKDSRIGNPDYDPAERVDNGGFDTDSDWTKGTGWSISGGVASSDGSQVAVSFLEQSNKVTIGKKYFFSFDLVSRSAGSIRIRCGALGLSDQHSTVGTHYGVITAINNTTFYVEASADFVGSVDNVSITEWSGEELVPDPDVGFAFNIASDWTIYGSNTVEQDGNAVKVIRDDNVNGAIYYLRASSNTTYSDPIVGQKYRLVFRAKSNGTSIGINVYDGASTILTTIDSSDFTVTVLDITIQSTNSKYVNFSLGVGEIGWFEIISFQKVTGLVAAYNMIPNGDTLVDISGEGNDGTITDPSTTKDGMVFSANNESRVTITSPVSSVRDSMTLAFRYKPYKLANNDYIISFKYGTGHSLTISSTLYVSQFDSAFNDPKKPTTPPSVTNEWQDAVIVYDVASDITKIYFNGVEQALSAGGNLSVSTFFEIGTRYSGGKSAEYNGEISDLRIFNYAFSEQEAQDYHNQFAKQISKKGNFTADFAVGDTI